MATENQLADLRVRLREDFPRFWEKCSPAGDCWLWTGSINNRGYGVFRFEGGPKLAHRVAWHLTHGGWPEGVINHICSQTRCVNPDHLEDVSPRANNLHGALRGSWRAQRCKRGHDWTVEGNLYFRPDGRYYCVPCQRRHDGD